MPKIKNNGHREFNEQFEELQSEYLKTRDNKVLGEMYKLTYQYQISFMIKYCQNNNLILDDDVLRQKAEDASTWFIDMYLRRPDFKVDRFTAYMTFPFRKIFFKNAKEELLVRKIKTFPENEMSLWIEDVIKETQNFNDLGVEILGMMQIHEEAKRMNELSDKVPKVVTQRKKTELTPHEKEQAVIRSYFNLFDKYRRLHPELSEELKILKEKMNFFILKHLIS